MGGNCAWGELVRSNCLGVENPGGIVLEGILQGEAIVQGAVVQGLISQGNCPGGKSSSGIVRRGGLHEGNCLGSILQGGDVWIT